MTLTNILEQYRLKQRGLPTYAELAEIAATPSLPVPAILTDERIVAIMRDNLGPYYNIPPEFLIAAGRAIEAELAAVPGEAEAVAYMVDWHDIGEGKGTSLFYETGAKQHMESAVNYALNVRKRPSTVTPLYTHPSPVSLPVAVDRNAVLLDSLYKGLHEILGCTSDVNVEFVAHQLIDEIDDIKSVQQSADKPAEES